MQTYVAGQQTESGCHATLIHDRVPYIVFYIKSERTKTDGANSEFSGARWRPRTVLSFEAS